MVYEDATIRVGNKGTIIDVTMYEVVGDTQTVLNLAGAASFQFEFKRKNGSTHLVTATPKNGAGGDGILTYTDTTGTIFAHSLAKKGRWEVRGIVTYANANVFKGSWEGFTVGE